MKLTVVRNKIPNVRSEPYNSLLNYKNLKSEAQNKDLDIF